jgi:diaminohydroxyphosphoribosylaminopyrimidine deaminase/5-amino-6-(5-phosphoribosylamino)uracil reductase
MINPDELFMQRALQLAELGRGSVAPNPLVGCVVVHEGRIIGEGWHQRYGEAHAEVNALRSVADSSVLPQATVYVTLEPCSHFGKTPPCADRLVQEGVRRVVVCNLDTNPLVRGRGIHKLRAAGIEVQTGVLEADGRRLNRRFFTFMEQKRPYVVLKWAETTDGFVAAEGRRPVAISTALTNRLVHRWRSEEQSIMVGTQTARSDNPRLNVRHWQGNAPLRIVIDRLLQLTTSLHLLDGSQPTIVYNSLKNSTMPNIEYVCLQPEADWIPQILADLYERKVQSVLVEGGPTLLGAFLRTRYWDELRRIRSPKALGSGLKTPTFQGVPQATYTWSGDVIDIFCTPVPTF